MQQQQQQQQQPTSIFGQGTIGAFIPVATELEMWNQATERCQYVFFYFFRSN